MATDRSLTHTHMPDGSAPAEVFQQRGTHNLWLSDGYAQELQGWVAPLAVSTGGPQPCIACPAVAKMALPFVGIDRAPVQKPDKSCSNPDKRENGVFMSDYVGLYHILYKPI